MYLARLSLCEEVQIDTAYLKKKKVRKNIGKIENNA